MPKVSFIIPVYNIEQYIERCVRSVLAQNFRDIECICVDDGSTDSSGTILDNLGTEFSTVQPSTSNLLPSFSVIHQENRGVSAARNAGLDAAKGEYVVFVDSDDALTPDFLDRALPCLDADKDLDLWIGQRVVVDMELNPCEKQPAAIPVMEVEDPINRFLRQEGRYYLYCVWGKVFRREVVRKYGLRFKEGVSIGEDSLFAAEYYAVCRKVRIDDRSFGYLHSQREGSLVRRNWADQMDDYMTAICELQEFGEVHGLRDKVAPLAVQWALGRFSVMFHRGYKNLWMRKYIVALCRHPEFKTTILDTIIKFGGGKYALAARVMKVLPRWMLIEVLFVAVCLNNLVRK